MKKNIITLLSTTFVLVLLSGCSSTTSTSPSVNPGLSSENITYNIIKKVEGSAECIKIFGIFDIGEAECYNGVFTSAAQTPVQSLAMSKAVDSAIGADAIMSPRFTIQKSYFPLLFTNIKVTVKGKAVEYINKSKSHKKKSKKNIKLDYYNKYRTKY